MLIKLTKKDKEKGLKFDGAYLTENKDNVFMTKSGAGYSVFLNELSKIKLIDFEGKEINYTGKELLTKLLAK